MKKLYSFLGMFLVLALSNCSIKPAKSTLNTNLHLAWMVQTGRAINHPPLIVGNTVIIAPSGAPLLALDLQTGMEKWTFAPSQGIWERAYASDGKYVFVGLKGCGLAALDISSGKVVWQKDLTINMQVAPLVRDGIVYASTTFVGPELASNVSGRAKLFALEAKTGNQIWVFESDNYILQTPALNSQTLFLGGNFYAPIPIEEGGHTRIYAINLSDNTIRWVYESEDGFPKRLYATQDTLVFVGYQDFINGIDIATGKLRWRFDTGNWTPSLLGAGDTVYFSSANTQVFAVNAHTGNLIWQFNIPTGTFNYLLDAPLLIDNDLYFLTQQGDFFALNATNGQLLWQYTTDIFIARTSPAVEHGWLIVGDVEGKVLAYR